MLSFLGRFGRYFYPYALVILGTKIGIFWFYGKVLYICGHQVSEILKALNINTSIMHRLHIITPVKDSWDTTKLTIEAIMASKTKGKFEYTVFNDYSNEENTNRLASLANQYNFKIVNLKDITRHSPPNYHLTLQIAKTNAILKNAHLLIIESDVIVKKDTIQQLIDYADSLEGAGMISAVTTDPTGTVNFPYLYAKKYESGVLSIRKRISFCCTLLTNNLLKCIEGGTLHPQKNWFDIRISRISLKKGFQNYLIMSCPVVHLPHSSRPWKHLKHTNPLKYYWFKLTNPKYC